MFSASAATRSELGVRSGVQKDAPVGFCAGAKRGCAALWGARFTGAETMPVCGDRSVQSRASRDSAAAAQSGAISSLVGPEHVPKYCCGCVALGGP